MNPIRMPRFLHEVFGERQYPAELAVTLLAGIAVPAGLIFFRALPVVIASWRIVVSLIFVFDIAAGVVANLSEGTNEFYKTKPKMRIIFPLLHWHLVVLFALLGYRIVPALVLTGYALGASLVVNGWYGSPRQRVLAGALVVLGVIPSLLSGLPPLGLIVTVLFIIKLVFSFSVDHYSGAPRGKAPAGESPQSD